MTGCQTFPQCDYKIACHSDRRLDIQRRRSKLAVEEGVAVLNALGAAADPKTLGHDLRTPLAIIHGYAQLLASDQLSPEQHARACELILEKCAELNLVIRRLLEPYEQDLKPPATIEQPA